MKDLGVYLRKKYVITDKLVHPEYHREDLYARSSDVDRCLMSGYSLLKGLYPTGNSPPVHTVSQNEEFLLRGYEHCHKYHQFVESVLSSDEMLSTLAKETPLFHKMSRMTGVEVSVRNVKPVTDAIIVGDELAVQSTRTTKHQPLPPHGAEFNATGVGLTLTNDEMTRVVAIRNNVNYAMKSDRKMARLMVGNLLRELLERIAQEIQGSKDSIGHGPPKISLYFAHDTTLMGLLTAMGVVDVYGREEPPFASRMEIELLELERMDSISKLSSNNYFVRISFNGKMIRLGECQELCPVSSVAQYLSPMIPSSLVAWSLECENSQSDLDGDVGGSRDGVSELHDRGYMGLDWNEWSTMAMVLSVVLVMMNVMFDHVVVQYFFERAKLLGTQPRRKGSGMETPSRGSHNFEPVSPLNGGGGGSIGSSIGDDGGMQDASRNSNLWCGVTRRSMCCGLASGGFIAMSFVFLVAFGVEWNEWPSVCFVIVSIITMEAMLMVGVTMYTKCLKPMDDYGTYGRIPTDDWNVDWSVDGGGVSDTI